MERTTRVQWQLQTTVEQHTKTIDFFSSGFSVLKEATKINFAKQRADYNRKITSLMHQAEGSTVRMGLKMNDEM